jgi:glycine/D-amino acid oxidase-like deaminating enzyme/nitrite reductase/ring-hydroxylating ferredoxin subunit
MRRYSPIPGAKSQSIWAATVKMPICRRLARDLRVDVCIVGAGIAGLTTAYLLGRSGTRVVVLDDGGIASGMTRMTTAHLSNAIDDRFTNLQRWQGEEGSRLAAQSHAAAIDRIEAIADELRVDCDFKRLDGYLFLAPGDSETLLKDEFEAARRAAVEVEMIDRAPLEGFDTGPCLRFADQARFHPFKYLAAMARAIKAQGGKICTNTHVESVVGGRPAVVKAGEHTVTADAVVVATNVPINDLVAIHTKQAPYMTYVIGAKVPRGAVTDALYWDTLETYHYVRLQELAPEPHQEQAQFDLLIVGGEDHKSGQADDANERHQRLEAWARQRFPIDEVVFTWGGQCMETIDGLAFIGRNPLDSDNVYVATGDSGMGITHGTIAGMLLTDMILGRDNPWAKLYEPSRKTLRAMGPFAKENLNVAAQYAAWVTPGEVDSVDDIAAGTGAVVRRGLTKIAVSRSDDGSLTELSAVCPHLGCIVEWNSAEYTWDCPCHGSRFRANGRVINGPANRDLEPVSDGEASDGKGTAEVDGAVTTHGA